MWVLSAKYSKIAFQWTERNLTVFCGAPYAIVLHMSHPQIHRAREHLLSPGFPTDLCNSTFITCLYCLPVNSVCWAPQDYGLILACGSSDGAISLLNYTGDGQWEVKKIGNAHTVSIWTFCANFATVKYWVKAESCLSVIHGNNGL